MTFIKKLAMASLPALILSASSTFASSPQPAACPSVAAIKAQGLAIIEKDDAENAFEVGAVHQFGTPQTWAFIVLVPFSAATSKAAAMTLVTQALPTLAGSPAPFSDTEEGEQRWVCIYSINNYVAAAATPISVSGVAKTHAVKALM